MKRAETIKSLRGKYANMPKAVRCPWCHEFHDLNNPCAASKTIHSLLKLLTRSRHYVYDCCNDHLVREIDEEIKAIKTIIATYEIGQ